MIDTLKFGPKLSKYIIKNALEDNNMDKVIDYYEWTKREKA